MLGKYVKRYIFKIKYFSEISVKLQKIKVIYYFCCAGHGPVPVRVPVVGNHWCREANRSTGKHLTMLLKTSSVVAPAGVSRCLQDHNVHHDLHTQTR